MMASTKSTYNKSQKRIALADQLDALQHQLAGLKHLQIDATITRLSPLKVGTR